MLSFATCRGNRPNSAKTASRCLRGGGQRIHQGEAPVQAHGGDGRQRGGLRPRPRWPGQSRAPRCVHRSRTSLKRASEEPATPQMSGQTRPLRRNGFRGSVKRFEQAQSNPTKRSATATEGRCRFNLPGQATASAARVSRTKAQAGSLPPRPAKIGLP